MKLLLINPNTSEATTQAMALIAQEAAPQGVSVTALTAPAGVPMIVNAAQLAEAAQALEASLPLYRTLACDGVITAAYGDPGLQALRRGLSCPVVGIGESSMLEARERGPFAVVTTTPDLAAPIEDLAAGLGLCELFAGLWLTQGDPQQLLTDPAHMEAELEAACRRAIGKPDLGSIIIGGGPLAKAARALSAKLDFPIIEPVPAAVKRLVALLKG